MYFENVGGEHLEAAIEVLNPHGRIAVCGLISGYNATTPPAGPGNSRQVISKRLRIEGFLASDQAQHQAEFLAEVGGALATGSIRARETFVDGLENAPSAFLGLLGGANTGKMLVRI